MQLHGQAERYEEEEAIDCVPHGLADEAAVDPRREVNTELLERLRHRCLEQHGVIDHKADVGGNVTEAHDAHAFLAVELARDLFEAVGAGLGSAIGDQIARVVTEKAAETDEHGREDEAIRIEDVGNSYSPGAEAHDDEGECAAGYGPRGSEALHTLTNFAEE